MTDPNVVFAKFVDANPVRDVSGLAEPRPDPAAIISGTTARSDTLRSTVPRRRGGLSLAAAAFVLVLAVGGLLLAWPGQPESGPADVPPSPGEVLRRDAVSTAEEWLAAVNAGDIDRVISLAGSGARREADRQVHEWQSRFAAEGMPVEARGCAVTSVVGATALVECDVRLGDVVAVELGVADLSAPFYYENGLITWQPYTGGNISDVNDAYATYLLLFHTAEYEARCLPAAYPPGSVIVDRGLALTGVCADLAAPLAADVVEWIRDGRPTENG